MFYIVAFAFMTRLVRLARESNATSIADLIATRLGKDPWLAAVVTLVALLGMVPYIALQLKAVTMSFATLTSGAGVADTVAPWRDGALYVALAMAVFAMAFGTRRASAAEHNRGLVMAVSGLPGGVPAGGRWITPRRSGRWRTSAPACRVLTRPTGTSRW